MATENLNNILTRIPINKTYVLDGGFGSLLESLGYSVNTHELWSGGANIDNPELVLQAHKLFIEAGAQIIETNTYHCSIQKMIDAKGYTVKEAEDVLKTAVKIAKQAIIETKTENSTYLVGSIGPYATYLRDASEYSASYTKQPNFQKQTIIDYYLQQAKPLIECGIKTLVFETIPSLVEVECLGKVLDQLGDDILAWCVVSCEDEEHLRSGDKFSDFFCLANTFPKVQFIGINCTSPFFISALLENGISKLDKKISQKPIVVYPNSGEQYNTSSRKCFEGETKIDVIAQSVLHWHNLGTLVIGGCCRVLPLHIKEIAQAVNSLNKNNEVKQ